MAIDASAVARVLGIETQFINLLPAGTAVLPQRIAVIGQGATAATYSTTKAQHTSAAAVGAAYGYGSPLHLAARQLFPVTGDGVGTIPVTFYPLEDHGSGVAAAGDITPSGTATETGTYYVVCNNIYSEAFTITAADTVGTICDSIVAAVNAVLEMPIIAADNTTDVTITAKWAGTTGNDLELSVDGPSVGVSFAFTQPTGGATNPVISTATAQFGNVWETLVVNCFQSTDTTILGDLSTFNEGRWGELVRRPFVSFTGTTEAVVATAIAVPDARKTDRTSSQIPEPGGTDLPCVIAARAVARIAKLANNNPPTDYGSQRLTGLVPGADGVQWTYAQQDQAVKGGSSTINVKDGIVNLADVITYYKPVGEPVPAFRYVVDIIKLQNIIFNVDLEFNQPEWDGAPLIPDDQPTVNPNARKPKTAKAAVAGIIDGLGLNAIISDPETAKQSIIAVIDSGNPKRLNIEFTVQLSGNTNIISIVQKFGFYFGQLAIAA